MELFTVAEMLISHSYLVLKFMFTVDHISPFALLPIYPCSEHVNSTYLLVHLSVKLGQ